MLWEQSNLGDALASAVWRTPVFMETRFFHGVCAVLCCAVAVLVLCVVTLSYLVSNECSRLPDQK